jgi:hypothetical protein
MRVKIHSPLLLHKLQIYPCSSTSATTSVVCCNSTAKVWKTYSVCCVKSGNEPLKSLHENPSAQRKDTKQSKFFCSHCKNLKADMLSINAEQSSNNCRNEGGTEYRKLTQCLEAYNETKRATHSGICFGAHLITSLASLLKMTPS